MSVIGTFKANGGEYTGEITTLAIQANDIRIVPAKRTTDAGPSHRVYAGKAEIGAAWTKRSKENRSYLSILFDDPSMMSPFYASLVSSEEGADHSLIWSRGSRKGD